MGGNASRLYNMGSRAASRASRLVLSATTNDMAETSEVSEEKEKDGKLPLYSWAVLGIILAVRICYQWQRSIFSYCYGYSGTGDQMGNAIFEIATEYPQLNNYFGLLTGFAYTIPFAVTGVFFGKIVNKVNRKFVLGALLMASGATMGLTGLLSSFGVLAACRVATGFLSAGLNPLSFSLLADYFPPERRTTANTILQSGNFMAWGLSSLSVLFVKAFGWRSTYTLIGVASAVVGLASMSLIKEPTKKLVKTIESNKKANEQIANNDEFDPNYTAEELAEMKEKPYKYFLSNPVNKWCIIGSFLRNVGGSCITYYLPVFFLKNFPAFKA